MKPIQFGGAYVYHKTLSPQAQRKLPKTDDPYGTEHEELEALINDAISSKIGMSTNGQSAKAYTLLFVRDLADADLEGTDQDSQNIVIDLKDGSNIEIPRKGLGELGHDGYLLPVHFIDDNQGPNEDVKNPVNFIKQLYFETLGGAEMMPKIAHILRQITPINIIVTDFDIEKGTVELTGDHPRLQVNA